MSLEGKHTHLTEEDLLPQFKGISPTLWELDHFKISESDIKSSTIITASPMNRIDLFKLFKSRWFATNAEKV